jgi:hypothetical protein
MLWAYAYGKPIEHVEHTGMVSLEDELRALTPDELHARALELGEKLKRDDFASHDMFSESVNTTRPGRSDSARPDALLGPRRDLAQVVREVEDEHDLVLNAASLVLCRNRREPLCRPDADRTK